MRVAVLTFDGFDELVSFIALGLLNRLSALGWKAQTASPSNQASQYLAAWILLRGAGEEAAKQGLLYAAPVGEKETYVERLFSVVRPFLPAA